MPVRSVLTDVPRSDLAGMVWPAIPSGHASTMLALQFQLQQSEWWPLERIEAQQFAQLASVLHHARATVPFYRRRFSASGFDADGGVSAQAFRRLPLLTRQDLQLGFEDMLSTDPPAAHGKLIDSQSSGSTGTPVRFKGTELTQFMWEVFTLRDVLWQRRDLAAKYGVIRMSVGEVVQPGWSAATEMAFRTGPAAFLPIDTEVSRQIEWLKEQRPAYLLTYASNLHALALYCLERGMLLPFLREVSSLGEVVTDEIRRDCARAWSVPLVDMYTAHEVGYIALQCTGHQHYHVQSENLLVEVLRDDGEPCVPGEIGKVVVTTLHNFAMPFVRYEIGDYAEVGEPCACGRGLPVLKRILGRTRNMLVLPNGEKRWPLVGCRGYGEPWLIRQFQFIQRSLDTIEVRLVTGRPLNVPEERGLRQKIIDSLGHPFRLDLVYCDAIDRNAGAKFEDFRCEVAAPLTPA